MFEWNRPFHRVHLYLQVNLRLLNHPPSNHHFLPNSEAAVHRHLILITCHPHFPRILSMVHQVFHPSIVYHPITTTITTVMHSPIHHEIITTTNSNNIIKIFFMIDFFFKWLLLVDNNNSHSMVTLHHPMAYGVQHFVLFLVSTKILRLFTTC